MFKKVCKNPKGVFGMCIILIVVLAAAFAPYLAPHDPLQEDLINKYASAGTEFPLGADQLGRCEFSRLVYGARYSIGMCLPIMVLLSVFGLAAGTWSAYIGGYTEKTVVLLCIIFMALPALIISAAITGMFGKNIANTMVALFLASWAWYVKMVRSYTLIELNKDYITAAQLAGCTDLQIVFKHLIPNVIPQFAVYVSTGVATAILTLSAFSFIGLGLPVGTPEWGVMLNEARGSWYSHTEFLLYPACCIMITALGFNLLGEALRDVVEDGC